MNEPSSPKLRVLALTSQFPNAQRPTQAIFNRRQMDELARLCTMGLVSPQPFTQFLRRASSAGDWAEPGYPAARPVFWYTPGVLRHEHGRLFLASAWPAIRSMARRIRPHVLYATWIYPDAWAGMRAAARLGLPLVVKAHGSDLLLFRREPKKLPLLKQTLACAESVAAVSRGLAKAAVELGAEPRKVSVVPNGVSHEVFYPRPKEAARVETGLNPPGPLLLFVGNLYPVKGLDIALRALARIDQATTLAVAGDGPMAQGLRRLARDLGVSGRVKWLGRLSPRQVAACMAACDALVLPSRSEGEPNVVLEALASGRPVAAARVGGAPDLVAEGLQGSLAEPEDPDSLAGAIQRVLARRWEPGRLAESVSGRTWRAGAEKLYQMLGQAAAKGGSRPC